MPKRPLNPALVRGLRADNPALAEARTIFPNTVIDARHSPRVLIPGTVNAKVGGRVRKGKWTGWPIYTLTLEERATCPTTCELWATCYGNGMPWARRHKHNAGLIKYLNIELRQLQRRHPRGFVVRLHILGDFYSNDYVRFWQEAILKYPVLHIFGYTHRLPGTLIGNMLHRLATKHWDRFAVRLSGVEAVTINYVARGRTTEGVVCPQQTDDTASCGNCGLCWADAMQHVPILFILHGSQTPAQPARRAA